MGRHNSLTNLIERVVGVMQRDFGCNPADMQAWLSPGIGADSYVMEYFDAASHTDWAAFARHTPEGIFIDIAGHTRQQLLAAGITATNIEVSGRDTATDEHYFCHNRGDRDGRMMMVSMIKQGEPAR
jgi:copper oxidase (laccase) domain-containing protein